jgi:hypothetical protein
MNSQYGQLTQAIVYDLTTHTQGFGGPTDDLRSVATSRVQAATAGVVDKSPSISRYAKKAPRDNSQAYYVAAYWLATGSLQTGYKTLAEEAETFLEEGDSFYDGWASWATGGTIQSGGEKTDKIQIILNDALKIAGTWNATDAVYQLKKLVSDNVNDPPDDLSLPERGSRSFKEFLISTFVPRGLREKPWIVPVTIVSLLLVSVTVPLLIMKLNKGGRK